MRERLIAALEDHFAAQRRRGPIALLVAPAGYGKSALLAQWAQIAPVPVAWYTLDESDNDLAFFLRGVTRAIESVVQRPRWRSLIALERLPAGVPSPPDCERLTDIFIQDLRRVVSRSTTLTLTNLHALQPEQPTATLLRRLLARQPDLLGLALESRAPWPIPTATTRQERRLFSLTADDVALTDDEYGGLLALRAAHLLAQQTRQLRTRCGGSIMAVALGIEAAAAGAPATKGVAPRQSARHETSLAALARQAIDALSAEERALAARIAILDPVAPSVCLQLLDLPDADERLDALARRLSCFDAVVEVGAETIYRFHPGLRASLLLALEEELDAAKIRELHALAGDILRDASDHEAAIGHYAEAQRYDRIAALIEERRGVLLRAGMGETLVRWIRTLPDAVRASHPRLQILLADLLRDIGDVENAWREARSACELTLRRAEQEPEMAARALLARGMLAYAQEDYQSASDDCARALELAPAAAADLQIQARFGLAQCLDALGQQERPDELLSELERRATELRAVATLSRYWYLRSKTHQAELRHVASAQACEQALRNAQEAEDTDTAVISQIRLGMMLACQGDYDEALKLVNAAREQARRAGYSRSMAYAVASVGDIERMRGAYDEAIAGYYRAQTLSESLSEPRLLAYVVSGLGYSYTLNGRSDLAVSLLRESYERQPDPSEPTGWTRKALALGLAWLREGEPALAADPIERAYALAPGSDDPSLLLDARLILSALRLAQGRDADASAKIVDALEALAVEDVAPVLLPTAQILPEIFPVVEGLKSERAAALVAALSRVERARSTKPERQTTMPAALRLYTFGGTRVFQGRVQVGGWRLPAALELLCYLVDRREPASKEAILAALWPDKTQQIANLNFRQAVFQLNRALNEKVMVKRDRRWTLAIDCWVDAHEFERLHAEGVQRAADGESCAALYAFRRALTYYRGPYLVDIDSPWAQRRAAAFAQFYLACLSQAAQLEEQLGRLEDAAQHWLQALAAHTPDECARCGLMRYYASRRDYENVRDQYDRLQRELGPERPPAAETVALYHNLMAGMQAPPGARSL
jgi:ATP/maltotriose-dependent transcriptional regulator MalT/DNA-binding SARP family transcriptional activator